MNSPQARYASRFEDALWFSVQAGPAYYGDWHTALWSGNAIYRPSDDVQFEGIITREAVETFDAFERRITADTVGLSASYNGFRLVDLAASVFHQSFSDDNNRIGGVGDITTLISARMGLSARLKFRYFQDSKQDAVGYFNPERYHEEQLLFILNNRLGADWRLYVQTGPGLQSVSPGDSTTTLLAEFSLQSRISRSLFAGFDFGYSDSAIASSSGYRRRYAGMTLSYLW